MNPLLSAKGGDVTAWRAVENFVAAYRQSLLDLAASGRTGTAESVLLDARTEVETAVATHRELLNRLHSLIEEVAVTAQAASLKELTGAFYDELYRYFDHFRSAPAFYQLSMAFLRRASAAIIARAEDQLGPASLELPEMALIAVGPAGRLEYSPFCPLQILLVHGETAGSQLLTIDLFCRSLHAGFEAAGLAVDPAITPLSPTWRGTAAQWRQRCEDSLLPDADDELINLCRLVDQCTLHADEGFDPELTQTSRAALNGSRPAAHLVNRMAALSNGLGIMGRLKLERGGSNRGMFRLLDHGLLPLSAALSALALIRKSDAIGTCDRIHDLLRRGELDVDLAERMLATWHCLHGLRLQREQSLNITGPAGQTACLNPDELTAEQRQSLREALESVANIQRHVEIVFSGMEG